MHIVYVVHVCIRIQGLSSSNRGRSGWTSTFLIPRGGNQLVRFRGVSQSACFELARTKLSRSVYPQAELDEVARA
jgi:hypothetical protein